MAGETEMRAFAERPERNQIFGRSVGSIAQDKAMDGETECGQSLVEQVEHGAARRGERGDGNQLGGEVDRVDYGHEMGLARGRAMPKLDLGAVEQTRRTGYRPPLDREVAGRLYPRAEVSAG